MAKWTVDDFIKEIKDLDRLNEARPDDAIIKRMAQQLENKIKCAGGGGFNATVLIRLSEAISATSLQDDLKKSLQAIVDDVAMSATNNGMLQVTTKSQTVLHFHNYLSVSEAQAIQTAPLPHMVLLCCKRLRMIGVKSIKEKTKKAVLLYCIHVLVSRGEPQPTAAESYKLADYILRTFLGCAVPPRVEGIAVYPCSPQDIGSDTLAFISIVFVLLWVLYYAHLSTHRYQKFLFI